MGLSQPLLSMIASNKTPTKIVPTILPPKATESPKELSNRRETAARQDSCENGRDTPVIVSPPTLPNSGKAVFVRSTSEKKEKGRWLSRGGTNETGNSPPSRFSLLRRSAGNSLRNVILATFKSILSDEGEETCLDNVMPNNNNHNHNNNDNDNHKFSNNKSRPKLSNKNNNSFKLKKQYPSFRFTETNPHENIANIDENVINRNKNETTSITDKASTPVSLELKQLENESSERLPVILSMSSLIITPIIVTSEDGEGEDIIAMEQAVLLRKQQTTPTNRSTAVSSLKLLSKSAGASLTKVIDTSRISPRHHRLTPKNKNCNYEGEVIPGVNKHNNGLQKKKEYPSFRFSGANENANADVKSGGPEIGDLGGE